ncbi:hypothetical protein EYV94_11900 [Puteibacter caeruleilacunae]|nr:hypothetical protein EYV94_11900 [Puteibacter caeruleilacunae]
MKNLLKKTILFLNLIFVVGLLISYIAPHVSPAKFWLPAFFGLAYPYLLVINILFSFFWILTKPKYALLSIVCIVIGFSFISHYIQFGQKKIPPKGMKILTYNSQYFISYFKQKDKKNVEIIDFLKSQEADIICLQEMKHRNYGPLSSKSIKSELPGIKHYQLAHASKWSGPITFSKFPIINMGELRFKNTSNMIIFSDIKVNTDTIRVYNCHLESYRIRPQDYSIIDSIQLDQKAKQLQEVKSIGAKLKGAFIKRTIQTTKLKEHISDSPYPVIVCGDFNDTPLSFTYNEMTEYLKDSFIESGSGISVTYKGALPNYRIDYIFHSKEFEASGYNRLKVDYSDHYPVTCFLNLKEKS